MFWQGSPILALDKVQGRIHGDRGGLEVEKGGNRSHEGEEK